MGPKTYFRGYGKLARLLSKLNISIEVINTKLPEHQKEMENNLHELLEIPRMSTFAIGAMINKGVSTISPDSCFVNVGVWHGFTFLAGIKNNPGKICIGIDNFTQFGGPRKQFLGRFRKYKSTNHHFYDVHYKQYFTNMHTGKIGFYIYDGDHDYDNQLNGLRLAEPFFSQNCIIFVDDTNEEEPRQATLDFVAKSPHQYQILLSKETLFNGHPTLWNGIMVLERVP